MRAAQPSADVIAAAACELTRLHLWRGRAWGIGRAFGPENVGFKRRRAGEREVYFGRQLIGVLVDTDPGAMRPAHWAKAPRVAT